MTYVRSFGIGAVAGLRTFTAPAAVHRAGESIWTGPLLIAAAGELVADKLPATPSRLAPPPFIARLISGGWCGGELAERGGGNRVVGLVAGACGAAAGAWAGYATRRALGERGIPDFALAVIEDGIAIGGAFAVARGAARPPGPL